MEESMPLRLHIGGIEPKEGWKILNIVPGPGVDYVGDCQSLEQFADASVERIYASHVYEHLGFEHELDRALREAHRVLEPNGLLQISVPDFAVFAALMIDPAATWRDQFFYTGLIFGQQADAHDVHKVGLTDKLLGAYLRHVGFRGIHRVDPFRIFDDWSGREIHGRLVSLNMEARK
jgi:predicted SAM-dependent methyltransferase